MPVEIRTKPLFLNLLYLLKPRLVLDIGSMNGAESLRFRRMLANAKIVAFEAHPALYRAIVDNPDIRRAGIAVVNKIVSPVSGSAPFYLSNGSFSQENNRGTSSTRRRLDQQDVAREIVLPTVTIDEVLQQDNAEAESAALWIDVEGAGFDVLGTLGKSAPRVQLIHIESELAPVWREQKLKSDIVALADSMGFEWVAHSPHPLQQDLVFINKETLRKHQRHVAYAVRLTRMLGSLSSRVLPILA